MSQSFRDRVKTIRCPTCHVEYSDFACEWGEAWLEGQIDGKREWIGETEELGRDGSIKLKCELCGQKAWINCFGRDVVVAEEGDRNGQKAWDAYFRQIKLAPEGDPRDMP